MSTEKTCSCEGNSNAKPSETGCGCGGEEKIIDCGCGGKTDSTGCGCAADEPVEARRGLKVVNPPNIYRERRPVKGEVVTVIDVTFSSSGIDLDDAWSRAVSRGGVHEIMLWDPVLEEGEDAAAVAFIEIAQGGNIINGDEVKVDGEAVGNIAGFDYNHMPNHMNIVVETKSLKLPVKLGSLVEFVPNPMLSVSTDCC